MKPFQNSFWYQQRVNKVQANSDALVADLVAQTKLASKPTMNTTTFSTTYYEVDERTPLVPVELWQAGVAKTTYELYKTLIKGIRIPATAFCSGGTDQTICIYDRAEDSYFDAWKFSRTSTGIRVEWGGKICNASYSNGVFPIINGELWGSAATSLPFWPGVISIEDVQRGFINHMLRLSIPNLAPSFKYPALRGDGNITGNPGIIEYGQIFNFRQSLSINPSWTPLTKMIVLCGIVHGFIVSDRSGCVTLYGQDYRPDLSYSPFTALLNGKTVSDVMAQIPWGNLQAVEF